MFRDDGLHGKVAVITGGASGIGQALAVSYARAGVRSVVGFYPGDPHDVDQTVALVNAAGGDCLPFALDVRRTSRSMRSRAQPWTSSAVSISPWPQRASCARRACMR